MNIQSKVSIIVYIKKQHLCCTGFLGTVKLSYSARAGQVLFSQVHLCQDKDGPLTLGVHLANQICYNAPLCIHTAIWRETRKVTGCVIMVYVLYHHSEDGKEYKNTEIWCFA